MKALSNASARLAGIIEEKAGDLYWAYIYSPLVFADIFKRLSRDYVHSLLTTMPECPLTPVQSNGTILS